VQNTRATDPTYGTTYIHDALAPFGLGDRWSFVNYDGTYHGRSADEGAALRGGRRSLHQPVRRLLVLARRVRAHPRRVFVDSDPAFTQLAIAKAEPWYVEFFQRFDHLFTFGANIGRRRRRYRPATSPGTRPGSRSRWPTGGPTARRAIASHP